MSVPSNRDPRMQASLADAMERLQLAVLANDEGLIDSAIHLLACRLGEKLGNLSVARSFQKSADSVMVGMPNALIEQLKRSA